MFVFMVVGMFVATFVGKFVGKFIARMFHWSNFWIRARIFRKLVFRYFSPWDNYFLNSIVFDIWYIARNADLAELVNRYSFPFTSIHFDEDANVFVRQCPASQNPIP